MKNKIFILIIIFLNISLQIFPVFASYSNDVPIWSDKSDITISTSSEPTFDIASEAGILIELTTRKSFI